MWPRKSAAIFPDRYSRRSCRATSVWPRPPATACRSFITTLHPAVQPAICSWHGKSSAGRHSMVRKGGLGKGMAALLQVPEMVTGNKDYFLCPIEQIRPNKNQPRKHFAPEKLEELAASIREQGIIQPLVVTQKDGFFEIIAGERRWRASQKAGLHEVPVVIREASDSVVMELALIENIQRQDLNAIEEAEAYRSLVEHYSISQEDVAKRVGKNRTTVTNALRLLKLPESIQHDIIEE